MADPTDVPPPASSAATPAAPFADAVAEPVVTRKNALRLSLVWLVPLVAVLIGAMLLSPLMMPIIGLVFGIATLDFHEIRRAATTLMLGAAIAVAMIPFLLAAILFSFFGLQRRKWQQGND